MVGMISGKASGCRFSFLVGRPRIGRRREVIGSEVYDFGVGISGMGVIAG
jgi:hypothetical protein